MHISKWSIDSDMITINLTFQILFKHNNIIKLLCPQDKEPKGIIPLENIQVRVSNDKSKNHCFELFAQQGDIIKACKVDKEGKVVEGEWSSCHPLEILEI